LPYIIYITQVETGDGATELAMMPTRFKKLIWIKRGDFVILSASSADSTVGDSSAEESGEMAVTASGGEAPAAPAVAAAAAADSYKVNFMIKYILSKPQIRHIQQSGKW
jgi:hypothetical protein